MISCEEIEGYIRRKWTKLRLQPIRVFCFHQVSNTFDASTMYLSDWTQIDQFKNNILWLKEQYEFISLEEAIQKLKHDIYRTKKYVVLTADDGWASLKNILPWLVEQQIPITLFVNPAYLKGEETRENGMNELLKWEELNELLRQYPNISIASHGWNHTLMKDMNSEEFLHKMIDSHRYLSQRAEYIPFYAYPCGMHSKATDTRLVEQNIVPVYMDGRMNYVYDGGIHRELLDGLVL